FRLVAFVLLISLSPAWTATAGPLEIHVPLLHTLICPLLVTYSDPLEYQSIDPSDLLTPHAPGVPSVTLAIGHLPISNLSKPFLLRPWPYIGVVGGFFGGGHSIVVQ